MVFHVGKCSFNRRIPLIITAAVNLFPSRKQLSPSQTVILIAMTLQEK